MYRAPHIFLPLLLIAALLVVGCEPFGHLLGASDRDPSTSDTVVVEEGSAVAVEAYDATFYYVETLGDSRCPEGVTCIWAGEAVIGVAFAEAGADTVGFRLKIPGFVDAETENGHQPVDTLGLRFTLLQLDPYPTEGAPPPQRDRVATVRIEELPIIPADSETVVVEEGSSAAVEAYDATFYYVETLGDSRCPEGVTCIWAGEAVIGVAFAEAGADTVGFRLKIPGFVDAETENGHQPVDTLGLRFTLLQLDPYPTEGAPPPQRDRVATVRIEKLP